MNTLFRIADFVAPLMAAAGSVVAAVALYNLFTL
jgi:hypothetical protein